MGIKDTAVAFRRKFRLDAHHGIERFGVFFAIFVITGVMVITGTGVSAFNRSRAELADKALYSTKFTTSKTGLEGQVDGIYTNTAKTRALVLMHFGDNTPVSYNAEDYQAFLLGSSKSLVSETLKTAGVRGSLHIFGSTGYIGVVLEATQPFQRQILNLTMRAKAELSFADQQASGDSVDAMAGDATFRQFDQWRVFFNPGATGTEHLQALESATLKPAEAFYEVVVEVEEELARKALDTQLEKMRADLTRIRVYSQELMTTSVDGLTLKAPAVPSVIGADTVTGESAREAEDGRSTLTLNTTQTVAGGFDLAWRDSNVYQGYLSNLVPADQTYVQWLQAATAAASDAGSDSSYDLGTIEWLLSDGTDLLRDYDPTDVTVRPLLNVANNLSAAFQDYVTDKTAYQRDLMLDLLHLDVDLRDVETNSSINQSKDFMVTFS